MAKPAQHLFTFLKTIPFLQTSKLLPKTFLSLLQQSHFLVSVQNILNFNIGRTKNHLIQIQIQISQVWFPRLMTLILCSEYLNLWRIQIQISKYDMNLKVPWATKRHVLYFEKEYSPLNIVVIIRIWNMLIMIMTFIKLQVSFHNLRIKMKRYVLKDVSMP
jgi:hypothetical protein